jgi:hypothetical protein
VADFPVLKSGAVAQYPSEKVQEHATVVYRFVDGAEQRFPRSTGRLRRWVIRLELLDEEELVRLAEFFAEQAGEFGNFSFFDPWDEVEYPDCSFENNDFELKLMGIGNSGTTVVVRENR